MSNLGPYFNGFSSDSSHKAPQKEKSLHKTSKKTAKKGRGSKNRDPFFETSNPSELSSIMGSNLVKVEDFF